jgi:hypothetical protein
MAYFGTIGGGGGEPPDGPWCKACGTLIYEGEPSVRVHFENYSEETRDFAGLYHRVCSKPYAALARVLNMNPWSGF